MGNRTADDESELRLLSNRILARQLNASDLNANAAATITWSEGPMKVRRGKLKGTSLDADQTLLRCDLDVDAQLTLGHPWSAFPGVVSSQMAGWALRISSTYLLKRILNMLSADYGRWARGEKREDGEFRL
eukprot:FR734546.1.p1 GENE.FR734546.1~~FR734546.1.p1  ORF type:complete len:144 (+),score=4.24 FR734546.1:42-434(+)